MNNSTISPTADAYVVFDDFMWEYIQDRLGPQRLKFAILCSIVYIVVFITGVIGNTFVCFTIIKNKNMHTSTNYYLFSLAVSDLLLLLLGLPNDVSLYWQQYPWQLGTPLCKLRALVSEMASYTSVLTIVAFSMERYLAICHPLHNYSISRLDRALKIIAIIWITSLISATPFAVFTKINYIQYPADSDNDLPETAFCAMLKSNIPGWFPIYDISFIIFFLAPMLNLFVLYILIANKIQSRGDELGANIDGAVHRDARHLKSRRNIIRMLVAVVVTFFICWCPFHVQRLFYVYGQDLEFFKQLNEWMFDFSGVFYYMSATMNPILYNLMSVKYRKAFRKTLGSCCRSGNQNNPKGTVTLRSSSMKGTIVRARKECSTELIPTTTMSNNVKKESYSALPIVTVEISQMSPRIEKRSPSWRSEGDEHSRTKPTKTRFDDDDNSTV